MSSEFERWMSLRSQDVEALPEYVLWTLTKEGKRVEGRVRLIPGVGPELRIYATGEAALDTSRDVFWSKVICDGAALHEEAEQKLKEFTARGWVETADSQARRAAMEPSEPV